MVEIATEAGKLLLEVQGSHKFWALRSRLEVPLMHVKRVYADPEPAMGWFQGWKLVGTDIPNVFRAGMFWQEGNRVFWDVRNPENTIVIELEDEKFAKLIVEVENPQAAIQQIEEALGHQDVHRSAAEDELDQFLNPKL